MIKKTLVSWYTLHTKCIVNSSTSVNKKRKQKTNLFYEYCYEFVDGLKSLELKNFLYWFLFPETKIIFENYKTASFYHYYYWERFEPRSHVKNRLSLIVRVNVVLTGLLLLTVTDVSTTCAVVIFTVKVSSITSVDGIILWLLGLIGQLRRDVIGRLSVKPWCYWLWRLVISNWCVSIRLLSQLKSRLLLVKLSVLQSFSRS